MLLLRENSKAKFLITNIVYSDLQICLDMHRVKSEHCKDDDDDDITDDERKSDHLINHPGAMQPGNYHRGKSSSRKPN